MHDFIQSNAIISRSTQYNVEVSFEKKLRRYIFLYFFIFFYIFLYFFIFFYIFLYFFIFFYIKTPRLCLKNNLRVEVSKTVQNKVGNNRVFASFPT